MDFRNRDCNSLAMPLVNPVIASRVTFAVKQENLQKKIFQILFLKDGSLSIDFPYLRQNSAYMAEGNMPLAELTPRLTVGHCGAAHHTLHTVKFTHHMDGNAHFSQDGKVRTIVRRKAVRLDKLSGHLFTIKVQGLSGFKDVAPRDRRGSKKRRLVILETPEPTEGLKVVAMLYPMSALGRIIPRPAPVVGPIVPTIGAEGAIARAVLLSWPSEAVDGRVLLVRIEPSSETDPDRETSLFFVGGFDPENIVFDHAKESGFMFLAAPIKESVILNTISADLFPAGEWPSRAS